VELYQSRGALYFYRDALNLSFVTLFCVNLITLWTYNFGIHRQLCVHFSLVLLLIHLLTRRSNLTCGQFCNCYMSVGSASHRLNYVTWIDEDGVKLIGMQQYFSPLSNKIWVAHLFYSIIQQYFDVCFMSLLDIKSFRLFHRRVYRFMIVGL
jgi:hypothetical protein